MRKVDARGEKRREKVALDKKIRECGQAIGAAGLSDGEVLRRKAEMEGLQQKMSKVESELKQMSSEVNAMLKARSEEFEGGQKEDKKVEDIDKGSNEKGKKRQRGGKREEESDDGNEDGVDDEEPKPKRKRGPAKNSETSDGINWDISFEEMAETVQHKSPMGVD